MATSNETSTPITIDQMIASAIQARDEHHDQLATLRAQKTNLAERIADVLVKYNEADRIVKALTPREPKVRAPKSKKEPNG
jgi:predicted  nucleic acid-binding Zn-ribbon protein